MNVIELEDKSRELLARLTNALKLDRANISLTVSNRMGFGNFTAYTQRVGVHSYKVVVNPDDVRTYRDLVVMMAHEMRHVWQYESGMLTVEETKALYNPVRLMFMALKDYARMAPERDANEFAISFEDKMRYKNYVLNNNQPTSHFVALKELLTTL